MGEVLMRSYNPDELVFLTVKLKTVIYSHFQFLHIFAKRVHPYIQKNEEEPEIFRFIVEYYKNHYLLHMSEIYTFFYLKKDDVLLNQLQLSEEKRLKLKNVRNYYAHLKSDIDGLISTETEFLKDLPPSIVEKDLMTIVGYTRGILRKVPTAESTFKKEIKEIFDLYPPDFFRKEIKESYCGDADQKR